MPSSNLWIAPVALAEGPIGTGPVDLSIASQVLSSPAGFDLPGGAGQVLDRAYRWFVHAANTATSRGERAERLLGAAQALNNLAVWSLTRWNHPDAGDAALSALQEADRLLNDVPGGGSLRAGVFFNLSQLAAASGLHQEAAHYMGLSRSFGLNVSELVSDDAEGPTQGAPGAAAGASLDREPADAMGNGKTQLMFWAALGDEESVRSLLHRGSDVDAVDDDGDTALLYAVSKGHYEIAKMLLADGADPNICGDSGVPIRLAASRGWTEMVRLLAANGADVDARSTVMSTPGVTAIMFAAGGGYVDCLRVLLELGANPDLVDGDGDGPLFYAQSNNQTATADVLLALGRDRR